MDATKEIAKFGNRSVVEIRTENRIVKYCACSDYDESKDIGSRWNFGHYYDVYGDMTEEKALRAAMMDLYDIDKDAKEKLNRMTDIAGRVINEILEHVDEEDLPTLFQDRVKLTEEEAEMFDIKDLVYPTKLKVVELVLHREQKATLKVVMPEDIDDDCVMDYVENMWDIEPDDDEEWEIDSVEVDMDDMSKDDVRCQYRDQLWNYNDIDEF